MQSVPHQKGKNQGEVKFPISDGKLNPHSGDRGIWGQSHLTDSESLCKICLGFAGYDPSFRQMLTFPLTAPGPIVEHTKCQQLPSLPLLSLPAILPPSDFRFPYSRFTPSAIAQMSKKV